MLRCTMITYEAVLPVFEGKKDLRHVEFCQTKHRLPKKYAYKGLYIEKLPEHAVQQRPTRRSDLNSFAGVFQKAHLA